MCAPLVVFSKYNAQCWWLFLLYLSVSINWCGANYVGSYQQWLKLLPEPCISYAQDETRGILPNRFPADFSLLFCVNLGDNTKDSALTISSLNR